MSVTEIFATLGGCIAGQEIYRQTDEMLSIMNPPYLTSRDSLPQALQTALRPEFRADMDLSKVRYVSDTNGFGVINWFNSEAEAITIGNLIYFKRNVKWSAQAHCWLLMHELVHVWQFQRRRSIKLVFSCDYGIGYANNGYEANPMEKEARDFVEAHFEDFWKRYIASPLPPPPPAYPHSIWLLQS